jgi:UDP-galactopyranose mutase
MVIQVTMQEPALTIAGAGLFGLTIARLCADQLDRRVILFETRDHIGGNAYSYVDKKTNIDVHKYGSHIFHTSNQRVWDFVNRFSSWIPYEHKVYSSSQNEIFSLPINLATIEKFAGRNLTPEEAEIWMMSATSSGTSDPKNFEELAIYMNAYSRVTQLSNGVVHLQRFNQMSLNAFQLDLIITTTIFRTNIRPCLQRDMENS